MKASVRMSFVVAAAVSLALAGSSLAAAPDPANLVGSAKCGMCHRKPDTGDQLGKWKASAHAMAFEVLASPEAKEVAAKLKIADAQKDGTCLSCHATANFFTEKAASTVVTTAEGVSCESCHGPGKGYMAMATMKDKAKATAAGLQDAKAACVKCHNDKNPTWKADRYTLKDGKKVGFDYDQAYALIKHGNPAKAAAK